MEEKCDGDVAIGLPKGVLKESAELICMIFLFLFAQNWQDVAPKKDFKKNSPRLLRFHRA